jgi:hypothetical protein
VRGTEDLGVVVDEPDEQALEEQLVEDATFKRSRRAVRGERRLRSLQDLDGSVSMSSACRGA